MLPVSAWPPSRPGASLSPFGTPKTVNLASFSGVYPLPKGAWIVNTTGNQVVMRIPSMTWAGVNQTPGTGLLPGSVPPAPPPGCPAPFQWPTWDDYLEGWRAWQRTTGRTDPPIRPLAGHRPPNFFGFFPDPNAIMFTLIPSCASGTVLADGQNVVLTGGGCATIIEAFSV
jgi:hypothetical protein